MGVIKNTQVWCLSIPKLFFKYLAEDAYATRTIYEAKWTDVSDYGLGYLPRKNIVGVVF